MSTTTTNYGFVKPALSDAPPDITTTNQNWDNLDSLLKEHSDGLGIAKNVITGFYTGDGSTSRTISVKSSSMQSAPKAVLVVHSDGTLQSDSGIYGGLALKDFPCGVYNIVSNGMPTGTTAPAIKIVTGGFEVAYNVDDPDIPGNVALCTNCARHFYMYIAIL